MKNKQKIIDLAIQNIKEDIQTGDYTSIECLLETLESDILFEFLSDKYQSEYDLLIKKAKREL